MQVNKLVCTEFQFWYLPIWEHADEETQKKFTMKKVAAMYLHK